MSKLILCLVFLATTYCANATQVSTAGIADSAITTAKITDGAVTNAKVTSIDMSKVTSGGGFYFSYMPNGVECADGEFLSWVAASDRWVCDTVPASGATTALDNLASVAFNADIVPDSDNVRTVGSAANRLNNVYTTAVNSDNTSLILTGNAAINLNTTGSAGSFGFAGSPAILGTGSAANNLSFADKDDSFRVYFQAPDTLAQNTVYTWPLVDGTNGYVLSTNGSGVMSWIAPGGGVSYPLLAPNGTAGAPSYSFSTDTDTGLYLDSANVPVMVAGGTLSTVWSSAGFFGHNGNKLLGDVNTRWASAHINSITMGNNTFLKARNAGNTADINILKVTTINEIDIGSTANNMNIRSSSQINHWANGNEINILGSGVGQAAVRFHDQDLSNWVGFRSPTNIGTSYFLTMPTGQGSTGQILSNSDGAGNMTWVSALALGLGTNALPTYSFTGDTNTGLYSSGANTLDFTTNGVRKLSIESSGHIVASGTAPTMSSCGTSPSVAGNDNAGRITVGTAIGSGCTLTFATAWSTAPSCVATNGSQAVTMQVATTTTTMVLTSAFVDSDVVNYQCMGF